MSISTTKSLIFQDIADIIELPSDPYSSEFVSEVKLHTVDKDLDNRDGVSVAGIHVYRDYLERMSDYIEIQVTCLLGTYVYDIYPYLHNIELTLYTFRQEKPGGQEIMVAERYKAVYLLERNMSTPVVTQAPRENLNQELPISLTLQLIDRSSETLRIKTLQGSFDKRINPTNTDMTTGVFLKSLLSSHVDKILIENRPAIDRLEIEPPHNAEELKAITIPTGTRLVDLADFIQNKSGGLYTSGVASYIQRFAPKIDEWYKTLYVYSLYDASKYHSAEYKIIFYSPPTSSFSMTDHTYLYKDKVLKVLVNSTNKLHDTKESLMMSSGSGFRHSNANSMMKKPVVLTPDGPEFKKSGFSTEVIHREREDNLNYAPVNNLSANHFAASSDVMSKVGKYIRLSANNVDLDFFYPGASCKVVYENNDGGIEELFGVIHRIKATYQHPSLNLSTMFKIARVRLNTSAEFEIYVTE